MPQVKNIDHLIWPLINETAENIELPRTDGSMFIIKPGERMFFPKQIELLESLGKYDCTLFGGAVHSGKSYILDWALIRLMIKWAMPKSQGGLDIRPPRVAPIQTGLFCNTYNELEDRHAKTLRSFPEWLGTFYGKPRFEYVLNDIYGGGILMLRNLRNPSSWSSVQFAAVAFDELTLTDQATFEFIMRSRKRWPGVENTVAMAATNPGGIGMGWVRRDFVEPVSRKKPEWVEAAKTSTRGYHFIKALPTDNPLTTKQYLAELAQLPEKKRRALMEGDWSVYEGQYFNMLDPNVHLIPEFAIPETWSRFRAIDVGGAHPTVCLWGATDSEGTLYVYQEYSRTGSNLEEHKAQIVQMSEALDGKTGKYRVTVCDKQVAKEDYIAAGNKTPIGVLNDRFDGLGSLDVSPADNSRIPGWQALASAFSYTLEGGEYHLDDKGNPVMKFIQRPKVFIFNNCPYTWHSLTHLIHDEKKVEDAFKTKGYYDPGEGDDEAETLRYLFQASMPSATLLPRPESTRRPTFKIRDKYGLTTNYHRF